MGLGAQNQNKTRNLKVNDQEVPVVKVTDDNKSNSRKNQVPHVEVSGVKMEREVLVPILLSEPVHVAGMVKLNNCGNYQELAAEINRVYSELTGNPRNGNPSMADPMPGFNLAYLPPDDDAPNLDPGNQTWQSFSALLDLILAVPK
ncbi:hypothetical protein Patl1_30392 [Pistacia atlantica]|uniref:Uncharacterized protein n=1 Tax=Pistacia atlantica TaxID=434234 RepID=A0ACC1AAU6_9ROSI|nr:hypothetical protein Patl1_30392 [Pistacia atlantica]